MKSRALHIALILAAGLLVYSNTFSGPFQLDEGLFIVDNPLVRNLSTPLEELKKNEALYLMAAHRYIGFFTFGLNYKLHGTNPAGYHIVNLVIHLLNALLVYALFSLLFRTPYLERSALKVRAPTAALFASLLFVCHPLQTEAVTYIFQRHASLVTLFYVGAAALYVGGRTAAGGGSIYYWSAFLAALAAMKTKQNAFTLPLMLLGVELLFFGGGVKERVRRLTPFFLTMAIIPLTSLLVMKESLLRTTKAYDVADMSRLDYLFTQFRVIATYIRLLFFPVNQNFDYDYPLFKSFLTPAVLGGFVLILLIAYIGIRLYRESRTGEPALRLAAFGILWFFLALSVESGIVPIALYICEYRVYLPSPGFFFTVAIGLTLLQNRTPERLRWLFVVVPVALVFLFGAAAYKRNALWGDRVSLWQDTVSKSPQKARPHNNLGTEYLRLGMYDRAVPEFEAGLAAEPLGKDKLTSADLLTNLGTAYFNTGRTGKAEETLKKALEIYPFHAGAHATLGIVYLSTDRIEEAETRFRNAATLNPFNAGFRYNLGLALDRGSKYADSEIELLRAFDLDPSLIDNHNNLGGGFYRSGDHPKAVRAYRVILKKQPAMLQAHYNLALALKAIGDNKAAAAELRETLKLKPDLARAHYNLGLILKDERKLSEAAREFEAALKTQPDYPEASRELKAMGGLQ